MSKHYLENFDHPKNYPEEMMPLDGKLKPTNLSFDILKLAARLASKKYLKGECSGKYVKSYVSLYCINTNGHDDLLYHCNNIKALNFIKE